MSGSRKSPSDCATQKMKLATLMGRCRLRDTEARRIGLTLEIAKRPLLQMSRLATLRDDADEARGNRQDRRSWLTAFATYKDAKSLTDSDEGTMLLTYRREPAVVRSSFIPSLRRIERHLRRTLSNQQSPARTYRC